MRPLARLTAASLLLASANAVAGPSPAPGYEVEITQQAGAIFCGLARDGDTILVTDLAGGRLLRQVSGGRPTVFGPALPHGVDVMGDPAGPYTIARHGSRFLVAQGATPIGKSESAHDHALVEIDEAGSVRVISRDFWTPFDLVVADGAIFVTDAARNSIERLNGDGDRNMLFTFARLATTQTALRRLSPTEFLGPQGSDVDAVPTGIAARNGRLYVALFGGFPFLAGAGRVVSVPQEGATPSPNSEAAGLNAPIRVAFDRNGQLLVLEHGIYDLAAGFVPGSGRLLGIDVASGTRQVLLDGLTRPAGLAVLGEGQIVIAQLDGTLIDLKPTPVRKP